MLIELDGVKLEASNDSVLLAENTRRGGFEPQTRELWKELCRLGGVFVDAGMYTGFYSILAAKGGADHVHGFEANQTVHPRLYHNLVANKVTGAVTVHPVALARTSGGKVKLRGKPGLTSAGTLVGEGKVICVARTQSMDDLFLSGVTAMKIDIERAEFNAIRGAQATIRKWKPHLLVELLEDGPVPELLRRWGYRCRPLDAGMYHFYV